MLTHPCAQKRARARARVSNPPNSARASVHVEYNMCSCACSRAHVCMCVIGAPAIQHLSPHLPTSPHISPHLPTSPHISLHLPTSRTGHPAPLHMDARVEGCEGLHRALDQGRRARACGVGRVRVRVRVRVSGVRVRVRVTLTLDQILALTRGQGGATRRVLSARCDTLRSPYLSLSLPNSPYISV